MLDWILDLVINLIFAVLPGWLFSLVFVLALAAWVVNRSWATLSTTQTALSEALSEMEGLEVAVPPRTQDRLRAALAHGMVAAWAIPCFVLLTWLPATLIWLAERQR